MYTNESRFKPASRSCAVVLKTSGNMAPGRVLGVGVLAIPVLCSVVLIVVL